MRKKTFISVSGESPTMSRISAERAGPVFVVMNCGARDVPKITFLGLLLCDQGKFGQSVVIVIVVDGCLEGWFSAQHKRQKTTVHARFAIFRMRNKTL